MMFGWGPATRIYLAAGATDMRKGFEGMRQGNYRLTKGDFCWAAVVHAAGVSSRAR